MNFAKRGLEERYDWPVAPRAVYIEMFSTWRDEIGQADLVTRRGIWKCNCLFLSTSVSGTDRKALRSKHLASGDLFERH